MPIDRDATDTAAEGGPTEVERSRMRGVRAMLGIGGVAAASAAVFTALQVPDLIGTSHSGTVIRMLLTALVCAGVAWRLVDLARSRDSNLVYASAARIAEGRQASPHQLPASNNEFNLTGARAAAADDDLEAWVHRFLRGPGANEPFSEGLWKQRRFWRGPVFVSLRHLERTCGPEEGMEYRESEENWTNSVDALAAAFVDIAAWPPFIVAYENGRFLIGDGNHRAGALERLGQQKAWIILWYADRKAFMHHAHHGFAIPIRSESHS